MHALFVCFQPYFFPRYSIGCLFFIAKRPWQPAFRRVRLRRVAFEKYTNFTWAKNDEMVRIQIIMVAEGLNDMQRRYVDGWELRILCKSQAKSCPRVCLAQSGAVRVTSDLVPAEQTTDHGIYYYFFCFFSSVFSRWTVEWNYHTCMTLAMSATAVCLNTVTDNISHQSAVELQTRVIQRFAKISQSLLGQVGQHRFLKSPIPIPYYTL